MGAITFWSSDDVKCQGNLDTNTPSTEQLAFNFQSGVTVYCLNLAVL